jgi:ankyrin repeat protein
MLTMSLTQHKEQDQEREFRQCLDRNILRTDLALATQSWSPWQYLVHHTHYIKELLEAGALLDAVPVAQDHPSMNHPLIQESGWNRNGTVPLSHYILTHDMTLAQLETLRILFPAGLDVTARNARGDTAFRVIHSSGNNVSACVLPALQFLVHSKPELILDIDVLLLVHQPALLPLVQFIFDHKLEAQYNERHGSLLLTAMTQHWREKCFPIIETVIRRTNDVHVFDKWNRSALFYAPNANLARLLVERGCDPLHQDVLGDTPLLYFVTKYHYSLNRVEIIRFLFEYGGLTMKNRDNHCVATFPFDNVTPFAIRTLSATTWNSMIHEALVHERRKWIQSVQFAHCVVAQNDQLMQSAQLAQSAQIAHLPCELCDLVADFVQGTITKCETNCCDFWTRPFSS